MDVTSKIRKSSQVMNVDIAEDQEAGDGGDLTTFENLPSGREKRALVDKEGGADDLADVDN